MSGMLIVAGLIFMLAGGVWLVVTAFTNSVLWGLITMLIPIAYVMAYWQEAKGGFLVQLAGFVLVLAGYAMAGEPLPLG